MELPLSPPFPPFHGWFRIIHGRVKQTMLSNSVYLTFRFSLTLCLLVKTLCSKIDAIYLEKGTHQQSTIYYLWTWESYHYVILLLNQKCHYTIHLPKWLIPTFCCIEKNKLYFKKIFAEMCKCQNLKVTKNESVY